MPFYTCPDPRDPAGEKTLDVDFSIESRGCPASVSGLPEDSYPAEPAEIAVMAVRDMEGVDVLAALTTEQVEAVETTILENYDFDDFDDGDWLED